MSTLAPAATRVVHAVCTLDCPDSCGVLVTVDDATGKAIRVQGDPTHPVTRGFLCGKVAKMLDRVYAPDRLLYPMRRKPGILKVALPAGREAEAFERISWETALTEIAARLTTIAADHGPESILPYSYAGTIGQLGYGSMDRRFFYRLGASQLDRTICSSAGGAALTSVYGIRLGTPPQDYARAGLIIAWGANIHGNNIHLWPFIEQARRAGAKLIVIDPYRTRTASLADEHLAIRPGTDTLLALSLMHVLFREGLEDAAYLSACVQDAEALRRHALLPQHAPEAAAAVTGISAEATVSLARAYGACLARTGRGAVIRLNYGVQRSENGGTAARAVSMLPLVIGSWQHAGGGLTLSTSGSFPFNTAALQMPELMLQSPLGRPARVVNMSELGAALTTLADPPVKAVFCYNSNPAAVAPNQNAVIKGMSRDDLFLVVHDQFFTDTADYADYVLPAPTFLETKDVQGSYGHLFAQVSSRAIEPRGEVRNNVRLFAELARHMGFTEPCFADREDQLIDQALTTNHPWFAGITRQRLEQEGHAALAFPTDSLPFSNPTWFKTQSGLAEVHPLPQYMPAQESRSAPAAALYPLEFLPRKADNYMNTTFVNHPGHQAMETKNAGILELHPNDATPRSIATGDRVEIFNARGHIELHASVSHQVTPGVVAARLGWNKLSPGQQGINCLTSETLTDLGGGATFYSTLVEVRKAT